MKRNIETPQIKGIKQLLRVFSLETQDIKIISGGMTNVLYEVKTQEGSFVIRVESETSDNSEITKEIMKNLSQRKIIPNRFIETDTSKKHLDRNVIITEKVEGTQFLKEINKGNLKEDEIEKIIREAIESGQKISKQNTSGFGRIGEGLKGSITTEKNYISSSLKKFLENPQINKILGEKCILDIKALFNENSHLFNCTDPRLVFIDFHFRNIIIKERLFQSLIDFDYFVSGDPILMFARLGLRTMENDPLIKEMIRKIFKEREIVGLKKLKLRLYTLWLALVSMFFKAKGEIEGKVEDIRGFKDKCNSEKIQLLLDNSYTFF